MVKRQWTLGRCCCNEVGWIVGKLVGLLECSKKPRQSKAS